MNKAIQRRYHENLVRYHKAGKPTRWLRSYKRGWHSVKPKKS